MLHKRHHEDGGRSSAVKRPRVGHDHGGIALALKSSSVASSSSSSPKFHGVSASGASSRDLGKRFRSAGTFLRERLEEALTSSNTTSISPAPFGSGSTSCPGAASRPNSSPRSHASKRLYQQVSDLAPMTPQGCPGQPSRSVTPLKRLCTEDLLSATEVASSSFSNLPMLGMRGGRITGHAAANPSTSARTSSKPPADQNRRIQPSSSSLALNPTSTPYERSLCSQFVQDLLISTLLGEDQEEDQ